MTIQSKLVIGSVMVVIAIATIGSARGAKDTAAEISVSAPSAVPADPATGSKVVTITGSDSEHEGLFNNHSVQLGF